ncbi:MAG: Tex family protein [Chitinophagaceae bacterium]
MEIKYIQHISEKLALTVKQINNVYELNVGGATIPFMARYRKEVTGNLDEVQIGRVVEEISYFSELDKRKDTVLKTIEGLGKLSTALKKKIEDCYETTVLEDIYLPYKPKRKTKASQAIEKGLEPLATLIFEQGTINPETAAMAFVNENVKDTKEALQGARDIIAEWVSEHELARNKIRQLFMEQATVLSKVLVSKKENEEAQKYRDYFEFRQQLANCPSHRVLAIRRGEKEGYLTMDITIEREKAIEALNRILIKASNETTPELKKAIEDSYDRLLKPSIENEFRLLSKNSADEEAINVFAENLRQLLLASPLGSKKVLALDPGFRSGCKLVCLDAQGNLIFDTVIYPHPPQNDREKSITELKLLVTRFDIDAIGIGNGTAGRETEQLVRTIDFAKPVSVFQVNESGASIYSASEVAREEFPEKDITVHGAVSIGRRLLDPLSELVKIDAKSIGVGQYQHDVNQTKLKDALDRVVESAVNFVGVDLNTASKHLLMFVSGLSATLAKNIIEYRTANGSFNSRMQLKKVALMGPKSFEQCAGFLRIPGAKNLLDNSSVHPESYAIVEQMARDANASLEELIRKAELRKLVDKKKYINEKTGEFTIDDILKELEKPGRDPRIPIEEFRFDDTIKTIDDVKIGMTVPGLVTNITNFGCFVDIGVKQDGLVHISQLSNEFISDPNQVVKLQQKVMVTVTEVDVSRKRIALTMKNIFLPERTASLKPPTAIVKASPANKIQPKKEMLNPFQAKLMELKKKFDK